MTFKRALIGFPTIAIIGYVVGMFVSAVVSGVAFASPQDTAIPAQPQVAPTTIAPAPSIPDPQVIVEQPVQPQPTPLPNGIF